MHPTDTLALSSLTIAKAAAAGEGSGRGPQVKKAPAYDPIIAGMSAAGAAYEAGINTLAAALEAMWAEPDPRSVTRTDAGASTSARMGEGFGKAYADHYGARGSRPKVFRADGSTETI